MKFPVATAARTSASLSNTLVHGSSHAFLGGGLGIALGDWLGAGLGIVLGDLLGAGLGFVHASPT